MRLFQFAVFNGGVCRAAGGKFNGWSRRNTPLSFIINGKCDEMCSTFEPQPFRLETFPFSQISVRVVTVCA